MKFVDPFQHLYNLGDIGDYSSLVLPRVYRPETYINGDGKGRVREVPLGLVAVIEPERRNPVYKLPAGHRQNGETPLQTAVRELHGETNLAPLLERYRYVGKWLSGGPDNRHWKLLFAVDVEERELCWMNNQHPENEGEEPKFFTHEEFYAVVRSGNFMREHYEKLVEFALILPLGRDQKAATA